MRTDRSSLQGPLNHSETVITARSSHSGLWSLKVYGPPILEPFLLNPQIESPLSIIVQTGSPSENSSGMASAVWLGALPFLFPRHPDAATPKKVLNWRECGLSPFLCFTACPQQAPTPICGYTICLVQRKLCQMMSEAAF